MLAVCFVFRIWPTPFFETNPILKYYRDYAAIGPFFPEHSVRSTYLMGISFKDKHWSPWNYPQLINHQKYLKEFSYQSMKRAEFEKLLSWYCTADTHIEFQRFLTKYLVEAYQDNPLTDSIRVMVLRRSGVHRKIVTDTLNITYYQVQ